MTSAPQEGLGDPDLDAQALEFLTCHGSQVLERLKAKRWQIWEAQLRHGVQDDGHAMSWHATAPRSWCP